MNNRRRFTRHVMSLPVRMRLLGVLTSSGWTHGRTVNISFEGISVELRNTIEKATIIPYLGLDNVTLEVEITFPHQRANVRAAARIIWHDWRAPSSVRIGMLFERMDEGDKTRWERFIDAHSDDGTGNKGV